MESIKFSAQLFITQSYKDCTFVRDKDETVKSYLENLEKKGIRITEMEFIKLGKSGRHDGYAIGWHFNIKGEVIFTPDASYFLFPNAPMHTTRFYIFHNARIDYFNCFPILQSSIKFLRPPKPEIPPRQFSAEALQTVSEFESAKGISLPNPYFHDNQNYIHGSLTLIWFGITPGGAISKHFHQYRIYQTGTYANATRDQIIQIAVLKGNPIVCGYKLPKDYHWSEALIQHDFLKF